jgi:GT2 family glycosyltransferase
MSRSIDVTVVVPTYQGAAYIDECLASIAAQDLAGVEVLVVDDGSSDDTVERAAAYADRIRYLRVERNPDRLGAVANFNRCIELARGRWIKPVFQDDLIEPGCLSAMRAARRRGVPVVVCRRTYRYEDGVPDWQRQACEDLVEQALVNRFGGGLVRAEQVAEVAARSIADRVPQLNFVGEPVTMLLERRAVLRAGGFDTGYVQLWDYELPVRLSMAAGMVLVDEPLATFRVHGGSETARNLAGSAFGINVIDRLRLNVAYATAKAYAPIRTAALRHDPPTGVLTTAIGVAAAARRIAEELPVEERDGAIRRVEEEAAALPREAPAGAPSPWEVRNAQIAMLLELSDRDLPEHLRDDAVASEPAPVEAGAESSGVGGERAVADEASSDLEPGPIEPAEPRRAGSGPRALVAKVGKASQALRTNEWWGHMLGPIAASACLQIGWRQVPPGEGLVRFIGLMWGSITLAAYGYAVNDASDVVPDGIAGKRNSMARLSVPLRLAVVLALAALGALPWLFIDLELPALVVLLVVYLCPLVYSCPPIRTKERLGGPVVDAANAFVLPALFAIFLFAPLGSATGPPALMAVGTVLWTTGFGLRAILLHLIDDVDNDRASGTRTVVTEIGPDRAVRVMRTVLFPVELVGMAALVATVATWSWGTVAVGVGYAAAFHAARLTGVIDRGHATTTIEQGWWLYWSQIWPALLLSLGLSAWEPWYLLLVGLILVLFWPRVRSGLTIFWRGLLMEARRHAAARRSSEPTG